ncbi:MAG: lipopolysaccharide biosynthesis protein [Chloroflexi bacterium]|nr:lipopolysaccharide biosynthesis protein [Chloroflexota bacterium]
MNLRLLHDLLKYSPGLALPILFSAGSMAIFARLASPTELGTYLLIFATTSSLSTPISLVLTQPIVRLVPAYVRDGRQGELLHAYFWLGLGFGALGAIVVMAVLALGFDGAYARADYLLPAMVMSFFGISSGGQVSVLEATFAAGRWSLFATATGFLRLTLPLLLFPLVGPVHALLWGSAAAVVAIWIFRDRQQRREIPMQPVSLREVRRMWSESLSFGLPFALTGIGDQVLAFSDRYIIAAVLGVAAVGLYSTNYSIAEKLLIMVQAPLIYAATPRVMSHWENDAHEDAVRLIRTAMRWLMLLGVPVVAFTLVRSRLLSTFVLGEQYADAHWVIPIVTAAILTWAASQYGHVSFQLAKRSWIIAVALASAALANVVSVLVLTTTVGYIGGAIGTAVGYAVYAIVIYVASRLTGPLPWRLPWSTLLHTSIGAAAAAAVWATLVPQQLYGLGDALICVIGGSAGLAIYGLLLLAFREVVIPVKADSSRGRLLTSLTRIMGAIRVSD